ncbi:teashirt homolog 2 [Thalassophryne amazonica]|uniref:teashirt homolog 2 n=1 Tax=Thalassophryne amazonica TaxID=390379 RepID=UPI001471CD08|nr:teashirt homolog 2 [Thalassophryne amazonica]XP_034029290.1 teashirt homolog 2 [Thalassophryne amazonica]XP_034029292.1 teashirt homolog 2 [Thalassophryne amazonica]
MPRRKQQAPKRAAVYMPDEDAVEQDSVTEEDGENDTQTEEESSEKTSPKVSEDRELDNKSTNTYSNQNSPTSVLSNQEAELESRLSDSSDRLSDFKTSSPLESQRDEESCSSKHKEDMSNSLEKMRAAYANFLSESYWTGIGVDLKMGKNTSKANCDSTNGSTKSEFDWHQDALSKTLQQTLSPKPVSKPNLFSSVHLYRQSTKPCGSVFTGASRFRCKDCSAAYDTLVELTVHMNKSGHYQDNNHSKQSNSSSSSSKSRKRNLQDMEGKEDAQKVLKCMFCGHSFDSLQDLSVHMIKTKHYQKVPLKEPIPVITPKLLPPAKKRAFETARPCSPDSTTGVSGFTEAQRAAAISNANSNRYGYQNGASYTWQFETCKSQILKCMECGSSHDTLQQLTTHMMVTGHFIKVTNSASKKGKQLALDPLAIEKMQGLAESAASECEGEKMSPKNSSSGSSEKDSQGEGASDKMEETEVKDDKQDSEEQMAGNRAFKYPYLREEDLEQDSGGGGDILKSLANTVASAINKAQTGTPSWSAYPSIHAAYQLSGIIKNTPLSASPPTQLKQTFNHKLRPIAPKGKMFHGAVGVEAPQAQHQTVDIKKEMVGISDGKVIQNIKFDLENDDSDCQDDSSSSSKLDADCLNEGCDMIKGKLSPDFSDRGKTPSPCATNGRSTTSDILSDTPDILGINPLSALQSVLNNHLGKANKPNNSRVDKLSHTSSIYGDMNRNEKPALVLGNPIQNRPDNTFLFVSDDQPIDLTKSKHSKSTSSVLQPSAPVPQKYALSDIADMVKVLPKATTPKPSIPSRIPTMKLESDVRRFEDVSAELYSVHKRKGRQSNWNPRHLLILQAQFASSLFQTSEGKYLLSDLGPQERMHISKFTGLSMTTISHWLANVKYQLRKTGGTKFLKNMDTGHPVFYCNDCASQFRSPTTFISHLESHLGFQIKDMCKMPVEHQTKVEEPELSKALAVRATEALVTEDDIDSKFKCKLCCRTFASNHAVKLHLSKTHSKSPDNHSQYVEMDKD